MPLRWDYMTDVALHGRQCPSMTPVDEPVQTCTARARLALHALGAMPVCFLLVTIASTMF